MNRTRYTILGWLVWRIGARVARRKLAEKRVKLGAAVLTAVAVGAGIAAARAGGRE